MRASPLRIQPASSPSRAPTNASRSSRPHPCDTHASHHTASNQNLRSRSTATLPRVKVPSATATPRLPLRSQHESYRAVFPHHVIRELNSALDDLVSRISQVDI